MPRYIDADAFIMEQCNSCDGACESLPCDCINCDSDCRCDMIKDLLSAPTISPDEVRGVVHGTWVGIDDFPHESWECDRCGCVVENTDDPWNYFHYCPNCGAKMEVSEDA